MKKIVILVSFNGSLAPLFFLAWASSTSSRYLFASSMVTRFSAQFNFKFNFSFH